MTAIEPTPAFGNLPPPDCLDETAEPATFGVQCEGCPADCRVLAAGRMVVEQAAMIEDRDRDLDDARFTIDGLRETVTGLRISLDEAEATVAEQAGRIVRLTDRIARMRPDKLVDTAYTNESFCDLLEHDANLRGELLQNEWGVLSLDARFMAYINTLGVDMGDGFVVSSGQEIDHVTTNLVRSADRRAADQEHDGSLARYEDRLDHPAHLDIIVRKGGDEYLLLIRRVDPDQLQAIAQRVQEHLSVSSALIRYQDGKPPFIASVASAHAKEMPPEERILVGDDLWRMSMLLNARADRELTSIKASQYLQMWAMVAAVAPHAGYPEKMPSSREVSALFLRHLCPDFMDNPDRYVRRHTYL